MTGLSRRAWLSCLPAALTAAPHFTGRLWTSIEPIYAAILKHPFLLGLTDGSLPREAFQFYLVQDALYLEVFSRSLNVLASKAPRPEWAIGFSRDAIESLEVERKMHSEVLASYGVDAKTLAAAEMAPANYAYANHLLAAVERGTFLEGLAAMLPCYWIYWEVGRTLEKKSSPNPAYRRWIAQYASEGYGATVRRVLSVADAAAAADPVHGRAQQLFIRSARYEYQFWDSAWRRERWTP